VVGFCETVGLLQGLLLDPLVIAGHQGATRLVRPDCREAIRGTAGATGNPALAEAAGAASGAEPVLAANQLAQVRQQGGRAAVILRAVGAEALKPSINPHAERPNALKTDESARTRRF